MILPLVIDMIKLLSKYKLNKFQDDFILNYDGSKLFTTIRDYKEAQDRLIDGTTLATDVLDESILRKFTISNTGNSISKTINGALNTVLAKYIEHCNTLDSADNDSKIFPN